PVIYPLSLHDALPIWKCLASGALLAGAGLAIVLTASADLAGAETGLRPYTVVGDTIPASLTGAVGDPERGRAIVVNRQVGLCLRSEEHTSELQSRRDL